MFIKNIETDKEIIITKHGGGGYCISPNSKILYYITCDSAHRPCKLYSYNIYSKKKTLLYTENEESTTIVLYRTSDRLKCLLDCSTKIYTNVLNIVDNTYKPLYKKQNKKIYHVDHFLDKWYILIDDNYSRIVETTDFKTFKTCIKHIKNAGKVISIFSLRLDINLIKKS